MERHTVRRVGPARASYAAVDDIGVAASGETIRRTSPAANPVGRPPGIFHNQYGIRKPIQYVGGRGRRSVLDEYPFRVGHWRYQPSLNWAAAHDRWRGVVRNGRLASGAKGVQPIAGLRGCRALKYSERAANRLLIVEVVPIQVATVGSVQVILFDVRQNQESPAVIRVRHLYRRKRPVRVQVVIHRQPDLFHVVGALDPGGRSADLLDGREQ